MKILSSTAAILGGLSQAPLTGPISCCAALSSTVSKAMWSIREARRISSPWNHISRAVKPFMYRSTALCRGCLYRYFHSRPKQLSRAMPVCSAQRWPYRVGWSSGH
ncbi:hypothetical protein VTN77DRAFT_5978 [Rasamsonia byssochlamydoides]|uniref:uncharacterized protein n=1 Tax=Rasamsonia byssochlamydoides TaxID=89139 RepID=UPI00374231EA